MSAFSTTRLPAVAAAASLCSQQLQEKEYASSLDYTTPVVITFTRLSPIPPSTPTSTRQAHLPHTLYPRSVPSTSGHNNRCHIPRARLHLYLTSLTQHNNGPTHIYGRQNGHRRQRHQNKSTAPLLHRRSQTIPSLQTRHRCFEGDQEISTQYRFVDFETAFC